MKALFLVALLALPAFAGKDDVEITKAVLARDTKDLPNPLINAFMGVDLDALPAKYQKKARAKRVELETLRMLADGKKRGSLRWPPPDCSIPKEGKSNEAQVLLMAGYLEYERDEVECVSKRTGCSEQQLMCEFSLNIVVEKKPVKRARFFIYQTDPLSAIAASCKKGTGGQNNFFMSAAPPTCTK